MRNTNKKGFTIVELVIVVAVIAILAAVLIPTFSSIIRKANESKDTQLIKNLNTAIAADVDGDKTMSGALAAAAEFGYDIGKINASATDNEILWDSVNNVFCYLKDGSIEYIPEFPGAKDATDADYWVIDNVVSTVYSTYLVDYEGESVEAKHSLDVTACGAIDVTYAGSATVSIFTNGGNITVKGGTVNHYGEARYLDKVAGTYNEFGTIVADLAEVDTLTEEEIAAESWTKVSTAEELTTALVNGGNIVLTANISVSDEISSTNANVFNVKVDTVINLNGFNISAVRHMVDTANVNNVLINVTNGADLVLTGYGVISMTQTGNTMGWSALSAALRVDSAASNGSITIKDAVVVEHTGGAQMAYGVDIYGNNTLVVEGGAIYSSYIAARYFVPNGNGGITVNDGIVSGDRVDVWFHTGNGDTPDDHITIAEKYTYTCSDPDTDSGFVGSVKYYID